MPPGSREGSAAPNGEPAKKKHKRKSGARAKEEAKETMAQNLQRHLVRLNGTADAGEASGILLGSSYVQQMCCMQSLH